MSLEYFTGIKFHARSEEFKSNPTSSASEAFEIARIGNSKNYNRITLYVKLRENILGIPYSELQHLEGAETNLEEELRKLAEARLNP